MTNHQINYVEFPARDLSVTKQFFIDAFEWQFEDYGPDYIAFKKQGIEGGFFRAEQASSTDNGAALVVLFAVNLEATQQRVEEAGGKICKAIFEFPGGRRFHFIEPSGNELAVWSDE
tara:strand:+ start:161 stop:511 length:351 start_codon:yes stop_codon:yes gene_type:complete